MAEGRENSLRSGGSAGIYVPKGAAVVLSSAGWLNAYGGDKAAGIGGGDARNAGDIHIAGGIISAYGGESAAGIGGGNR